MAERLGARGFAGGLLPGEMNQPCLISCFNFRVDQTMPVRLAFNVQAANALQVFWGNATAAEGEGVRRQIRIGIAVMREYFGVAGGDRGINQTPQ